MSYDSMQNSITDTISSRKHEYSKEKIGLINEHQNSETKYIYSQKTTNLENQQNL